MPKLPTLTPALSSSGDLIGGEGNPSKPLCFHEDCGQREGCSEAAFSGDAHHRGSGGQRLRLFPPPLLKRSLGHLSRR